MFIIESMGFDVNRFGASSRRVYTFESRILISIPANTYKPGDKCYYWMMQIVWLPPIERPLKWCDHLHIPFKSPELDAG